MEKKKTSVSERVNLQPWELSSWDGDIAGLSLRKTLEGNSSYEKKVIIGGDCLFVK